MKKILLPVLCLLFMATFSFAAVKGAKKTSAPKIAPPPVSRDLRSAPFPAPSAPFVKKANVGGSLRVRYGAYQASGTKDSFGISRARINIRGEVAPDVSFFIQPDFASASTGGAPAFADVYVEVRPALFTLKFGQFLLPFAYDSGKYKVIYGGGVGPSHYNSIMSARDYGIRVAGDLPRLAGFYYDLAVVNGAGSSAADVNKSKDVAGRINYKSSFADVGLSGYWGKAGAAEIQKKDAALDIEYKFNPYLLVLEFLTGGNAAASAKVQESSIQLSGVFGEYEPLLRYEAYDPDVNSANNGVNTLTLGMNYIFDRSAKIVANYNFVGEETTPVNNNNFIVEFQAQI